MADPYISVVIVARNDNYGENFLLRLNTFVRSLDYQVKNYPGILSPQQILSMLTGTGQ